MNSHSKIVVCLLIAATLAVDLVVVSWMREMGPQSRMAYVYDALVTAQLAVVTIWAVLGARSLVIKWIAIAAALGISAVATARLEEFSFAESAGVYASFVALLALILWVLKQTRLWRRLGGSTPDVKWQFSTSHLLVVTTVVALMIVAMRRSFVLTERDMWKSYALLTLGDVALTAGTLIAWQWARSLPAWFPIWLTRFAPVTVVYLVVGLSMTAAMLSGALGPTLAVEMGRAKFDVMAYTFIAASVIFLYLELAPIVTVARRAES